jgi:tetratricopeptide (TPR) repeat protein
MKPFKQQQYHLDSRRVRSRKARRRPPQDLRAQVEGHLSQALGWLEQEQSVRALASLLHVKRLLSSAEEHEPLRTLLADSFLRAGHVLGMTPQAITAYSAAEGLLPAGETFARAQLVLNRGLIRHHLGQHEAALLDLSAAVNGLQALISEQPAAVALLSQAFRNRAELELSLHHSQQALADLQASLGLPYRLDSGADQREWALSCRRLGLLRAFGAEFMEARAYFSQAISAFEALCVAGDSSLCEDWLSTLMHRAEAAAADQDFNAARADCGTVLAELERLPAREAGLFGLRALSSRGALAQLAGDSAAAVADFQAALVHSQQAAAWGLDPVREQVRLQQQLAALQPPEQALLSLQHAAELLTGRPEALPLQLACAQAFHQLGREPEAVAQLMLICEAEARWPEQHQTVAEAWLQRGLIASESGQAQVALAAFGRALALCANQTQPPESPEDVRVRARYFSGFCRVLELDDDAGGRAEFLALEALYPGYASYDLACLLTRAGEFEAAFAALARHLASPWALEPAEIGADSDLLPLHVQPDWERLGLPR